MSGQIQGIWHLSRMEIVARLVEVLPGWKQTSARLLMLTGVVVGGLSVGCSNPVAEKCDAVCDRMVSCSLGQGGQNVHGREAFLATTSAMRQMHASCQDGCTRFQEDVFACHDENRDSCSGFGNCMMSTGVFED